MVGSMGEVQEFLEQQDGSVRDVFERIRGLALEVAPDAEEGTSYGLPALKHRGKPLLGFRVAKQHLSIFPFSSGPVDAVGDRLAGWDVSKGTIRFSAEHPPPDDVLREVLRLRMQEIDGA